jgi:hypothetical protein
MISILIFSCLSIVYAFPGMLPKELSDEQLDAFVKAHLKKYAPNVGNAAAHPQPGSAATKQQKLWQQVMADNGNSADW